MEILNFEQAISSTTGQPHLLLGNGFSRACKDDIFSYRALLEEADFSKISKYVPLAFERFETQDFEKIIKILRDSSKLLEVYNQGLEARAPELLTDSEKLKEILVAVIARRHPGFPSDISEEKYLACRTFLSNFKSYYTLSYDLLLYWALLHEEDGKVLLKDDGFRESEEVNQEYVIWSVENTNNQNVFYLHGALHIFDSDSELKKYTWNRTNVPLMAQIRDAINASMFPLFVAEGTSKQKLAHINHSGYLNRGMRSISNIGGTLFTYGFSFKENDDHIIHLLEKSRLTQIFVSLFGNPSSIENQRIISKVTFLNTKKGRIKTNFYDAMTAKVWG